MTITNISTGKPKSYIDAGDKANADEITKTNARVSALESTVNTDGTGLAPRVTQAEKDIDSLETRMNTAEADIDQAETNITTLQSTKAPNDHASTGTTYGVSTATKYGHAKASSAAPKVASGSGAVGTDDGTYARGDHVHPVQTTVSGNAGSATKLETARTISITDTSKKISLSQSFNGTANISFTLPTSAQEGDISTANTAMLARASDVASAIATAVTSAYKVKGTKTNYSDLPTTGNTTGDVYNVTNASTVDGKPYPAGTNWVWTGTEWDPLGGTVDLSPYQKTLSAGQGLNITDQTIKVTDSGVTAGTYGSVTQIPKVTVDRMGRVTSVVNQTVYPPTTAGTASQYWMSDGSGAGAWTTPATAATSGSTTLVSAGGLYTELAKKQNNLTFETTIANTSNPLRSSAVYAGMLTKQDCAVYKTFTLTSTGWATPDGGNGTTKTQSVTLTGLTSDMQVFAGPGPDADSQNAWSEYEVYASKQASNTLTFTATGTPASNFTVCVTVLPGDGSGEIVGGTSLNEAIDTKLESYLPAKAYSPDGSKYVQLTLETTNTGFALKYTSSTGKSGYILNTVNWS